jgi:hypothetical protein
MQNINCEISATIIIAAIISVILSDWKDAVAIAIIVVLNAALGFI